MTGLQRRTHFLTLLLLGSVLVGCHDRQSPSPPPRVPHPKVDIEPQVSDPIPTGPLRPPPSPEA